MIISPPYLTVQMPTLDWPYILGLLAAQKEDEVVKRLRNEIADAMKPR